MRQNNAFFIAVELYYHELCILICNYSFTILFCEVTVRSESFQAVRQLYESAFVVLSGNGAFMYRTRCKCVLERIPGIFFKLFVSKLKLAVVLINTENNDIDMAAYFRVFGWVIETLEPAEIADVDHTTNTWCKL